MKRWLKWSYVIFILFVISIFFFKFNEITKIFEFVLLANKKFLFLALTLQLINFIFIASSYKSILNSLGYKIGMFKLYRLSIVMTAMNVVFPSAGLLGNTALFYSLKNHHNVSEGDIILSIIMYWIALVSSFIFIVVFSLLFLIISKKLELVNLYLLIANTLFIIVISFFLYELIKHKKYFVLKLENILRKVFSIIKRDFNQERYNLITNEFYEGASIIKKEKMHFFVSLSILFIKHLIDVMSIYLIFLSFNVNINVLIIILALTLANIFSLVSFIPGGIGIFELGMLGAFISLGMVINVAIATVLIFRAISFWLPVLIGLVIYKSTLKI